MKKLILSAFMASTTAAIAQTETPSPLKISGYIETYYLYDFGKPQNNTRPGFVYSHNRHNEVTLNLGFVKAAYEKDNVRANLALMTGTYSNANLAAEPGVLKNIFEANVGVKVSKTKNLWIDAGIFPSHIGFESAIGKDCWNLTRSILADNSPYFESGAKISYTSDDGRWFVSGLVLNGWQRIQRVAGNSTPAFGHQLTFKPNAKITLNSSSFVGSDTPDSSRLMRYFHNFYGQFQLTEKVALTLGFDVGSQQKQPKSSVYNTWIAPIAIVKMALNPKWNAAARVEYYGDRGGVIITTNTPFAFETWGYSINFDRQLADNAVWRVEARHFSSKNPIFENNSSQNTLIATSLAVSF